MNKKIIVQSIFAAAIILLTGMIPALASLDSDHLSSKNDLITIEVNHYLGRQPKQTLTTVTTSDAEEIRLYLTELYEAQERNDHEAISTYEKLLNQKGIVAQNYQDFEVKTNDMTLLEKINHQSFFSSMAGENISNRLCYFNAIGEGLVMWGFAIAFWKAIGNALQNISNPIAAFILLLVLLPLGVTVMLLTNLIPFRIFAPTGALALRNGTVSAFGLNGFQRLKVGAESYGVNLSGFTGITISIPPINDHKAFLFVTGFALKAEGLFV